MKTTSKKMQTTSKKNLFSIPLKFRANLSWDWLSSLRFLGGVPVGSPTSTGDSFCHASFCHSVILFSPEIYSTLQTSSEDSSHVQQYNWAKLSVCTTFLAYSSNVQCYSWAKLSVCTTFLARNYLLHLCISFSGPLSYLNYPSEHFKLFPLSWF